jgi:hypothetical protein
LNVVFVCCLVTRAGKKISWRYWATKPVGRKHGRNMARAHRYLG